MENADLWRLSACDLAEKIASRDVSATEAVDAALDRMHATNGAINAVVDDLSDSARDAAAALDRTMAASGPVGPLHGVPVTIKENTDQKGHATPNGVAAYKDLIAPADSPFVANLKAAGAVVIGRTNTPEFSFRLTTENPLHGRTRNPWNDWASAGGSSGGAAAAVMSGMGAIAHGTDIAGSLRFPSACTGATTVKPGLGRTPAWNPSQATERGIVAQVMAVQGVICREVRDVRRAMQAAIAYRPEDPWQVAARWDGPAPDGPIRVGVTRETYGFDMHPAVSRALDDAEAALRDAGYVVEPVETPDVAEIAREAMRTLFGEMKVQILPAIRDHGAPEFNAYMDRLFAFAPPYEGEDLLAAMGRRAAGTRRWLRLLAHTPLVLTPFLLGPPYAHGRDYEGQAGLEEIWAPTFYSIAMNFMGLPAGNIAARVEDDLPMAVQIVGQRLREDLVLDACEAIEQRVGVMAQVLGRS
ncbi:MAG: amidase [Pseudomonadota bacterium]